MAPKINKNIFAKAQEIKELLVGFMTSRPSHSRWRDFT